MVSVVEADTVTGLHKFAMRVRPELSNVSEPVVQLSVAIVNCVRTPDEVIELATRLWPRLFVYRGHSHLRLMPDGDAGRGSIYVQCD